jgi:RND family efflux transporter MFP subunit
MHVRFIPSLALGAGLALAGCSREPSPAIASSLPPAKVRLETVHVEKRAPLIEVSGTVRPIQHAQLSAKVMGTIEELPVSLGQAVRAGDLLVKISASEISARVVQAQSQLSSARRDLDRERDLLAKGASTADMVKGLEDRFSAAEAMVREAEAMLSYTRVVAPFDGIVARKFANAGDLASPGLPLLELEGVSGFLVEADVPDSLAAELSPGAELSVEAPNRALGYKGTVAEVSSAADANSHTVLVKIRVPAGPSVRSGEFARVQIPGEPVPTLLVPRSAVTRFGQMERVFVAGGDHAAVLRLVKTGAEYDDTVEILSGLDDGEQIVTAPPVGMREGQPLEAMP